MAKAKKNAKTKTAVKGKSSAAKDLKNTAGKEKSTGAASEIIGVVLICLGILFAISAYFSIGAIFMKWIKQLIFGLFGIMGYIAPVAVAASGVLLIVYGKRPKKVLKIAMGILGILSVFGIIHLCYFGKIDFFKTNYFLFLGESYTLGYSDIIGGGFFGGILSLPLYSVLGIAGTVCVLIAVVVICLILVFNISLRSAGVKAAEKIREKNRQFKENRTICDSRELENGETEEQYFSRPVQDGHEREIPKERYSKREKPRNHILLDDMEVMPREDAFGNEYADTEEYSTGSEYLEEQHHEPEYMEPDCDIPDYAEPEPPEPLPAPEPIPVQNKKLTIIGQDLKGALARKSAPITEQYVETAPMRAAEPVREERVEEEETVNVHPVRQRIQRTPSPEPEQRLPHGEDKRQAYVFPPTELLDVGKGGVSPRSGQAETRMYSEKLESTLKSFGVMASVINTERGPKVTRYELQPAPGVKISRIVNLANDIALNLAAESVRIEAPIPGKAAIGIELPNKEAVSVIARDLIDTPEFRNQKSTLSFALGKDIMGRNVYADLSKMPHLLVAGTTGSGKSVCLNMIILSLLFRTTPEEVKLMLIDPKRGVEMAKYNGIPNLITPVVTEPAKAAGALTWAVTEMINRYKALNTTGSRNIERHNEILKERGEEPVAKLVIVIDEFADLMMVSSKEVEDAVCRIAQLGRASGIHLVIATQSPRADIFTGLIKANVPSRIALTVGNALESRIIMDSTGAETLLGAGDMLFRPIGVNKPTRVQGCWVSDSEIENVVGFLKNSCDAEYDSELENQIEKLAEQSGKKDKKAADSADASFEDDLTKKAIKIALDYDGVSASMLQRRLRVGYARASRLVDELESLGIVGPADGSKPRQLLITHEDYMRIYGASEDDILEDFDD